MTMTTPLAHRLLRLTRLALHLLRALALLIFDYADKSALQQGRMRQLLARQLLAILHVTPHTHALPAALSGRCLLASNHISWLDIFLINAVLPATFVSKAEVAYWPLVGRMCTRAGTLYLERGSKSAMRRANQKITHMLGAGALVAICPEGATTYGDALLPFHAALFQPAVDAGALVLPAALGYRDARAQLCKSAGYVGEDSLLESVWAIVSTRRISALVNFSAPIDTTGLRRRELAHATAEAIAAALGVPAPVHAAGKRAHPPT